MLLTPEREQQMIEENMPKIYRAVDNYMARCSSKVINVPYEDFIQEVSLVFLQYIRSCDTEKQASVFPWYSAMQAMRRLIIAYQPLKCTTDAGKFSQIIHDMPKTISLDAIHASICTDIDGMERHWVDDKDTQMDFDDFMDSQTENTRRVASMRVYGMTLKEIGEQCGVSKVAIYKKLNKLNEDYKKYCEEDETDGRLHV